LHYVGPTSRLHLCGIGQADQWNASPAGQDFREYEKNLKKDWLEGLTLPRTMPKMRATCSEQRNTE